MKKIWIKLVKHFQGGDHTSYMLVNESVKNSKSEQNEIMENWGENSDGGQNYGYRVEMFFLKKKELPPIEWIEKEKNSMIRHIGYLKSDIKETEEMIKIYEEIIKK
jgi:hypothetical protein